MNTATVIVNEIYKSLEQKYPYMDYTTYSKYYLGRNSTYFSYLKSSGENASVEVLFNLYATLLHEEESAKDKIMEADTAHMQRVSISRSKYYEEIKNRALDGLIEVAYERHQDIKENDE